MSYDTIKRIFAAAPWYAERCRRDDANDARAVRTACDALINGPHPDAAAVAPLATRMAFPHAAEYLHKRTGASNALVKTFFDRASDSVMESRIGSCFLFSHYARAPTPLVTREILRKKLGNTKLAERAAAALAALGEIDWPSASRRVRAAYVLRLLVLSLRERAP